MYQLAENLGKSVKEVQALPAGELAGWIEFYLDKERQRQVAKGNLVHAEDDSAYLQAFGIGE
jgi:hypothetical protein